MSKFKIYRRNVTGNLVNDDTIKTALDDFKEKIVENKPLLIDIQNNLGGRALAIGTQSGSNYNSFLVITYYTRPKEFVYDFNSWHVNNLVTSPDLYSYQKSFAGRDFDTIIEVGNYGETGISSGFGCTNYPVDKTGLLIVYYNRGICVQLYYTYDGSNYIRAKLLNYSEWSNWNKYAFDPDYTN